ncbi:MAG: 2-oxo acid dehydrogenase subunit E2 [Patulibacter sp.]
MAVLTEVAVPDIGDFTDVPVVEVLVAVGDVLAVDDPIVELESDKASFEVPSTVAGVIRELRVGVGDKVGEGTVLVVVEPADAPAGAAEFVPASPAVEFAPPARDGVSVDADPDGAAGGATASPPVSATPPPASAAGDPPYASPVVRRLARERGVELAALAGSGEKGRITKADVEAAAAGGASGGGAAAPAGALGVAPWPQVDFAKFGPVERVALTKIQRLSAANLARNWSAIPHVTQHDEADITELEALRKQLCAEQPEVKVTLVALLLKACARALQDYPRLNSSLDGDELVLKRYYHLGFAADTPNGLVVPVVRDVDRKGVLELAGEVGELSAKARAGKLMPAQMSGGTFSISSLGGIGGTGFTPIVNAPEVAILGVVRSQLRPVWDGGQFVPRLILPLSLSYDHRVIDGALAARFTAHLARLLTDYRRLLL